MINEALSLAERLESLDARDAPNGEFDAELSHVSEPELLLRVAELCLHSTAIAAALYRRGMALGAPEETLRGFLALACIFEGDPESASQLLGGFVATSSDEVLLSAWANLDDEPGEVTRRLVEGLSRCPNSLRLYRQLADHSLRVKRLDLAKRAHQWLFENEPSDGQRERVRQVMLDFGWLSPG